MERVHFIQYRHAILSGLYFSYWFKFLLKSKWIDQITGSKSLYRNLVRREDLLHNTFFREVARVYFQEVWLTLRYRTLHYCDVFHSTGTAVTSSSVWSQTIRHFEYFLLFFYLWILKSIFSFCCGYLTNLLYSESGKRKMNTIWLGQVRLQYGNVEFLY